MPTIRELVARSPFHRTEPHLSRLGGLLYLLQSLRQQFLFPQVLRHGNGGETMIFGDEHDGWMRRYSSKEAAERGHAEALQLVCGK